MEIPPSLFVERVRVLAPGPKPLKGTESRSGEPERWLVGRVVGKSLGVWSAGQFLSVPGERLGFPGLGPPPGQTRALWTASQKEGAEARGEAGCCFRATLR